MDDLDRQIQTFKTQYPKLATGFDTGYEQFKAGVMLREARRRAKLTQAEIARRMKTKREAISRMENHAEDVKLSTLFNYARACGQSLDIRFVPLPRAQ